MYFFLFQNHCFAKWSAADPRCDNEGCWELSLLSNKHGQSSQEPRGRADHHPRSVFVWGWTVIIIRSISGIKEAVACHWIFSVLCPASGPRPLMKPHIIAGPQNISAGLRQSVVLECFAEGNPRPLVSWSRADSKPIDVSGARVLGNGNLIISAVKAPHSGTYLCRATTPGTRNYTIAAGNLTVLGKRCLLEQMRQKHFWRALYAKNDNYINIHTNNNNYISVHTKNINSIDNYISVYIKNENINDD